MERAHVFRWPAAGESSPRRAAGYGARRGDRVWWWLACTGPDRRPALDEGLPVDVTETQPPTCASPTTAPRFTGSVVPGEPDREQFFTAQGLGLVDLDGDDLLDLLVTGRTDTFTFRGTGAGFTPVDWLPGRYPASTGVTFADYDDDADLDVLLTGYLEPVALLRNDGAGDFVDVTEAAGLSTEPRRSIPSSWGDFDRDGDLDLWIGGFGEIDQTDGDPYHVDFPPAEPDWLYVNDGDGTFTDRSDVLPQALHDGYALAGGWHDVDRDGWLDLYPIFDFGQSFPSHLLRNQQGTLVSDGGVSGLDVSATGMGLGAGDLNGDGIDDFVVPAWDGNWLLLSGASGRGWFDYEDLLGPRNAPARGQKIAWGGELADLENDGDLDAFVTYGFLDARYPNRRAQPDAVYVQDDDGQLLDEAPALGLDQPTVGRGSVLHDLDGDGSVDWVRLDLAGPTLIHRASCTEGAWLQLRLRQEGANHFAIGAHVVAVAGERVVTGTVRAGGVNYASSGPPEVHLGLGDVEVLDHLVVRWPDGGESHLRDVDTRRTLTVTRLLD